MGPLATTGKEGALRARYVAQLEANEDQLKSLEQEETGLKAEIESLKQEIDARLKALQ
jgi:cell division protein FtsB